MKRGFAFATCLLVAACSRNDSGAPVRPPGLALGTPMLMMGFTQDGQADERTLAARDARFGVSSAEKRRQRADIDYPPIDPAADAGQTSASIDQQR